MEEGLELNMGAPLPARTYSSAMADAIDAAVQSTTAPGQAPPDAATLAAARSQAEKLASEVTPEMAAGLRDLQNLALSVGLPSVRHILRHMIIASGKRGAAKAALLKGVAEMSEITEAGCLRVEYVSRVTRRPEAAYFRMDQCPRLHNLDKQLDKIRATAPEEKMAECMKHLGSLVWKVRDVYHRAIAQALPLVRQIFDLAADDPCTAYLDLRVDMANTTLYVNDTWPNRIGIYIALESELGAQTQKP